MKDLPLSVDPNLAHASTLSSSFYKDHGYLERSKDRIFARSWQWMGDLDPVKIPGAVWPITLLEGCLDEPVLITRDSQDRLHVLSNVCTHRGMLVAESPGNERFLRCRYHGRRFGLDGQFQSMPEFDGVCAFPTERDHLAQIPFGTWGPFLFLNLDPQCALEEFLRPVAERLNWFPLGELRYSPGRSRDYLIKAHWALYCDNFLEGFHIPFIHSSLNEALDYGSYEVELLPQGSLQIAVSKGAEGTFDLPSTSPDLGKKISAYYYWLFPNLMLNFYPWGLSVNVVKPLGPEHTRVSFRCYVSDESKLGAGAGTELDRVEREDEVVVEGVQKGVKSRFYDRGRFSVAREEGVHHFHRMVAAAMSVPG
jgi:choline monooxygenase